MSGHTPMMLLTTSRGPGRERSSVSMAIRRDCFDCIQSRCSTPFNRVTINSNIEKDLMSQRPLMQFFGDAVSEAAHQKRGNLQESLCSHSQDTPCSSPPDCEIHQKEKRVMLHCRLHSEVCPKLPDRCLDQHNICQLWRPLLLQTRPISTSWCKPRLQRRGLRIPHQTAGVPSPSQPHVSECAEASHSEERNRTGWQ